ncbi:hypothetical protein BCV72DRAFT_212740, partial [Rhizopus microsporus var. microsporus]
YLVGPPFALITASYPLVIFSTKWSANSISNLAYSSCRATLSCSTLLKEDLFFSTSFSVHFKPT